MAYEGIKKKQHLIFPVLDILLNGLNYLFHVYVSWYLSALHYGELNALLSVGAILLVTGISFQIAAARKIAASPGQDRVFLDFAGTAAGLLLLSLCILLPLIPVLIRLVRSSLSSVVLILLIFTVNLILSIYRGMMQGQKRFLVLNLNFYIEVGTKILLLLLLLPRLRTVNTALITILGGMALALAHSLLLYGRQTRNLLRSPLLRFRKKVLSAVASEGSSQFALYFFSSVDMILVNYFLTPQSGMYAVVLKYCQLLFFVSFSILTVFVPHLSEEGRNRSRFLRLAGICTLILTAVCLLSLLFYRFIFPPSVTFFFNDQYAEAAQYLFLGGAGYGLLVLSFVVINYFLVLERRDFLPPLFFAAVLLVGILILSHGSIRTVLLTKIGVFALLLLILSIQFFGIIKKEMIYEK